MLSSIEEVRDFTKVSTEISRRIDTYFEFIIELDQLLNEDLEEIG